jgi:hypothetical protein
MRNDILHYYRQTRAHQMSMWATGGGTITRYPGGKTELSYGSAPYGEHAVSAYQSARSHIHFMKTLKADMAAHKKRSRAARRGWKTRRAAT